MIEEEGQLYFAVMNVRNKGRENVTQEKSPLILLDLLDLLGLDGDTGNVHGTLKLHPLDALQLIQSLSKAVQSLLNRNDIYKAMYDRSPGPVI